MNTDQINEAFEKIINERGVHTRLGIDSQKVRNYRQNLKSGQAISMDLKLQLLQKYGWRQGGKSYYKSDLISLLKFYKRTSQAARDNGEEYVIEKWEKNKK